MLRLVFLLLLGSALLLGGCKKDLEPEPTLEGRWHLQGSTSFYYGANKALLSQSPNTIVIPNSVYVDFTSTTITSYYPGSTTPVIPAQYYTQHNNNILFATGDTSQILVLTTHNLKLRGPEQATNTPATSPERTIAIEYDYIR